MGSRVTITAEDMRFGNLMKRRAYMQESVVHPLEVRLDWLREFDGLYSWGAEVRLRVEKEIAENQGILKSIDDEIRALGKDPDDCELDFYRDQLGFYGETDG